MDKNTNESSTNSVSIDRLLRIVVLDQLENNGQLIAEDIIGDLQRRRGGKCFDVDNSPKAIRAAAGYARKLAIELKLVAVSLAEEEVRERHRQYELQQTKLEFYNNNVQ